MSETVRVELTPRMIPVDDAEYGRRVSAVEGLADMGQIDPSAGAVDGMMQRGWLARINGTDVPAQAYALESGEGSQIMLSLLLNVDSLSIGDPSLGGQAADVRPAVPGPLARPMWGTGTQTIGAQVAAAAEKAVSA